MRDTGVSKFSFEGDFTLSLIELRSLVALGMSVSLISSMNGTLLISEISTLIQDIETEKISRLGEFGGAHPHLRHKEVLITKEMFDVPVVEMMEKRSGALSENSMTFSTQSTQKSDVLYKGHQVSASPLKGHIVQKAMNDRPIAQQKEVGLESTNSKSDIAIRLGRRNTILKLIKDKREVTIREVSVVVPDVSEKTIQRELLNLVSEGVLKKTGEKRWSKYSLNS